MQYTLSILVENQAGVLSKISGLFSRRGFNIDSLAVGVTNNPEVSRITIVANGDEYVVEQLEKQLNKVIPVIKVKRLDGDFISRELILIKVHCAASKRAEIIKTAEIMNAKIVDAAQSCVTIEYCECTNRVNTLIDLLKPYGIREIVRTGTIAVDRGNTAICV
ncbi:MAG: acetolactate synthase small subunit [Clostridia bacterium]|nr:acetolactate synthase small subunit [Clostridia bacterium]